VEPYSDLTEEVFRRALEKVRGSLSPALMERLDGLLNDRRLHDAKAVLDAVRTTPKTASEDAD
jgi:hypothetical protein